MSGNFSSFGSGDAMLFHVLLDLAAPGTARLEVLRRVALDLKFAFALSLQLVT